jgi:GNAT superfamily N-acetyltransferase
MGCIDKWSRGGVIRVRLATGGDAAGISVLLCELGYPADEAFVSTRLTVLSSGSDNAVLVAECDGEIAGFLAFHVIPLFHVAGGLGRIIALSVSPHFQRRGIGRELVAAAESFGRDRGCLRVEVTSGDKRPDARPDAHAFYQGAGYREDICRVIKPLTGDGPPCGS